MKSFLLLSALLCLEKWRFVVFFFLFFFFFLFISFHLYYSLPFPIFPHLFNFFLSLFQFTLSENKDQYPKEDQELINQLDIFSTLIFGQPLGEDLNKEELEKFEELIEGMDDEQKSNYFFDFFTLVFFFFFFFFFFTLVFFFFFLVL